MESEAQEAMLMVSKENAKLVKKAEADLKNKITQIKQEAFEYVQKLTSEAHRETELQIAKINEEYRLKEEEMELMFTKNREAYREKILNEILFGEIS